MRQRSAKALISLVSAVLLVAGCDGGPSGQGGPFPRPSIYAAALTLDGRVGEFVVTESGSSVDVLALGGLIEVKLDFDRSIVGRLYVPAGVLGESEVELRFQGSWRMEGDRLRFESSEATFLSQIAFEVGGSQLTGAETAGERGFVVSLQEVASADPTLVGTQSRVLEYAGGHESVSEAGTRLWMVVTNTSPRSQALLLSVCPAFARGYLVEENRLIWDQSDDPGCEQPRRLAIVGVDEWFRLDTPLFSPSDVFGGEEGSGTIDLHAVLPLGGTEVERFAERVIMSNTGTRSPAF